MRTRAPLFPSVTATVLAATLALGGCQGDPAGPSDEAATSSAAVAPTGDREAETEDSGGTTTTDTEETTSGDPAADQTSGGESAEAAEQTTSGPSADGAEESTSAPSDTEEAAPLGDGPVNVLVIGTDSREPGSFGGLSDSIMVLHLPADREDVALVSFTRDMYVDIPGVGYNKINAAFVSGGTDLLTRTVSDTLGGLRIDYTVQANFGAFDQLIGYLGGIQVDNRYASTVRGFSFPAGEIWLDESSALTYARQRKGLPLGDLDRAERHRAVLIGVMERLQERLREQPQDFPELVRRLHGTVRVTGGLDPRDAAALAPVLRDLDPDEVVSLMAPLTGFDIINGAWVNLVDEQQTAALGRALREDRVGAYVEEWGTGYAP
ncbi:LCP family protein [Serinicoccus kebangsaanensis]|uniref:LCP family protein n=1 Tax=Serinicoccus kebangsaanensis TaxID=2602069 RepID=UPI00124BCDAD|nr:LCP family protein [Serinicoccus kebangsaanensis]